MGWGSNRLIQAGRGLGSCGIREARVKIERVNDCLLDIKVNDVLFCVIDDGEKDEIGIAVKGENDCVSIFDLEKIVAEAKKMLRRY